MYTNFDDNMTAKYGIIVKGWPLHVFCSPGDVRTFTELKLLHDAWQSGTAYFYRLTTTEATEWSNRRFEKATEETSEPETSSTTQSTPSSMPPNLSPPSPSTPKSPHPSSSTVAPTTSPENRVATSPDSSPDPASASVPDAVNRDVADARPSESEPPSSATPPLTPPLTPPTPPLTQPTASTLSSAITNGTKRSVEHESDQLSPRKRHRQGPSVKFINSVTSVDGSTVIMNRKPRKERSDRGKKRGSRSK